MMGILTTLIGIVVLLGIVSTIYADGNLELSIDNAKDFGQKFLDTIEIWRMTE